jgi:superfamily II RNA helicase
MKFHDFTLDPFQENSIKAIEKNHSVVVSAPTGSGKTLIADFIIHKHKNDKKRIIYTAPIKALSNQKYKDFSNEYGADKIGLMTGDIVINPHAKVLIMTTEIYRNMVVSNDEEVKDVAYVIFDEVHYINDIERGYVWEESIIYSPKNVRFLCLSATIPNAQEFADWIKAIKKHNVDTVIATKRNVPLRHLFFDYELGITSLERIKKAKEIPSYDRAMGKRRGKHFRVPAPNHLDLIRDLGKDKLPCLFFSFSRKDCQEKARDLGRKNFFKRDSKITKIFDQHLKDAPPEISRLKSTRTLKEVISQGIAFHHAGLLPVIKEAVEDLFGQGLIKVLYTTETFAVGINMPAKTVCFADLRKYDGFNFRPLNTKEYFQIAGRAGRRGIDTIGYVVSMIFRPTFRYSEIKRLTSKDIEPIKSQFRLSVNTTLNLIEQKTEEEIEHILRLSFFSYQKFGEGYADVPTKKLLARYNSIYRKLQKLEYIKEGKLTEKGFFSSKVFADEITLGEIFATGLSSKLDEYQILLVLAALIYEPREKNKFKQKFRNEQLKQLKTILHSSEFLGKEKKFLELDNITTLINPVYNGKTFFDVLEMTNLLEGDLIRIYGQILDRLGQIKKASTDYVLLNKIANCKGIVDKALEGIYLV